MVPFDTSSQYGTLCHSEKTVVDERYVSVATTKGSLRGVTDGHVDTYLSVPFAAPPVGQRRFAPPAPVDAWQGTRDALERGPSAPQDGRTSLAGLNMVDITGGVWRPGDDYLALNVWAPAGAEGRPVMVYIHGGGLTVGSKDAAVYSGATFARDGVVAVNINYRLGAEGFLPIDGAPTNLGLRDMIAALHWVRDEIVAFGGDPDNVTVFGESGGAVSVACLLASPLAKGLFRHVAVQSGHGSAVYSVDVARRATNRLAKILRIAPTADAFRTVPPADLIHAFKRLGRPGAVDLRDENGFNPTFGLSVVDPVFGDDVLPEHPLTALAQGAGADVDMLIGTTSEEARLWFGPTRLELIPRPIAKWALGRLAPHSRELFDAYSNAYPGEPGGKVLSRVLTDIGFRWPARLFGAAHQGRTWMYECEWPSPAAHGRLGAAHGMELPFVFDTIHTVTGPREFMGTTPAPQEIADRAHHIWLDFAALGRAPWPQFDEQHRHVYRLAAGHAITEPPLPAAPYYPAAPSPQARAEPDTAPVALTGYGAGANDESRDDP